MVKIERVLQIITYLSVILCCASVIRYVEHYHTVAFSILLVLSIYANFIRAIKLPRRMLNGFSLLVLVASSLEASPHYLVEPFLGALIILIAIKLLEEKTARDYLQIYAMCVFLLIGSTLMSLSLIFLVYFLLLALLATAALVLLSHLAADPKAVAAHQDMARILLHALLIWTIALPLSAFFFVILPRTNFPLLSFLNKNDMIHSGFSDRVQLGQVSQIQEDNSVIFRAQMHEINAEELYWRGIVLDAFDGISWESGEHDPDAQAPHLPGPAVEQIIYLEPYGNRYLFALDKPVSVSVAFIQRWDTLTYSLTHYLDQRIRYHATSVVSPLLPGEKPNAGRYLQLPPKFSPAIEQLVAELCTGREKNQRIEALLYFFKRGNFRYSTENLPVSRTPLEDFLFRQREGNCEYFASSLAVMLRMAGTPSRLVGGYRGGYYNRAGGYYMVLQKNAHVWVEAYLPDQGWIRLDPTRYALADPSLSAVEGPLLQLRLLLDTFNYYWFRFIINYDVGRQLLLLNNIRNEINQSIAVARTNFVEIVKYLMWLLTIPAFGAMIHLLHSGRSDRAHGIVKKFLRKLSRYGYAKGRGEGLEEFVARIEESDLRERADRFVADFENTYYRDREFTREDIKRLKQHISEI